MTKKDIYKLREQLMADPKVRESIRRGLADCKAGRMIPLSELKRELGL